MKCTILHEGKGRMRVHVEKVRMTLHRADVLEAYLNTMMPSSMPPFTSAPAMWSLPIPQTFRCHRCTGGLQVRCGRV